MTAAAAGAGNGSRDPIRAVVEAAVASGAAPAACWWVGGPEGTLSRGAAGHATLEPDRRPVTESTPFDLASLTKPLATAVLAVLLESEGRLDLDEAAVLWLPELARTPYVEARLLDLGTHRAGLPAWAPLYVHGTTIEAYVDAIARLEPAAPPGATLYSDLGYILLGVVLERAGAAGLDDLFERRIAGPLALASTGFAGRGARFADAAATERGNDFERRLAGPLAAGHAFRTEVIRGAVHDANAWEIGGVAGHAGLFGTAAEAAAIARGLLPGGGLALDPRAVRRLLSPVPEGAPRTLGFQCAADSATVRGVIGNRAVGHLGFTGTSLWIEPWTGGVQVLLTNRVHPAVPVEDFRAVRRAFHAAATAASHGTDATG